MIAKRSVACDPDGPPGLQCPDCRDDGRQSRLQVAGVEDHPRSTSTGVTFVCPRCEWTERYEL